LIAIRRATDGCVGLIRSEAFYSIIGTVTNVIGLTGGIGTGKSTVARMLAKLGATVIDADAIVRELESPGSPVLKEIVEAFGAEVLTPKGELDREALGAIVFRNREARVRLNAITHPRVGQEMAQRTQEARKARALLVVLDIPLLLEAGRSASETANPLGLDAIVVVYAPEDVQMERQMAREGYERAEALRRIRAQRPIEEKRALADFVVDNSGSREETERQVRALFEKLSRHAAESEH
jgi:dephospho-CoA kinase